MNLPPQSPAPEPRRISLRSLRKRAALRNEAASRAMEAASTDCEAHLHLLGHCGGFPPGSLVWCANFDVMALPAARVTRELQRSVRGE